MAVAEETFFPVRVLEALTAAPGRGLFADFTIPRTRNCGARFGESLTGASTLAVVSPEGA